MRNKLIVALAMLCFPYIAEAKIVHMSTKSMSLVIDAQAGEEAKFIYFGSRISDDEIETLRKTETPNLSAYPVYGMSVQAESALSVIHTDGNLTLDLAVEKVGETKGKDAKVTMIELKDRHYPFFVSLCYRTYYEEDIIEMWAEYSHKESAGVMLTQFASAYIPVRYGDVWLSQFYGSWANEARIDEAPLNHGMKVIKNRDGVRNSHTAHSEIMLSLDGKAKEKTGRVIGAALCYSGNYKLRIDTDESNFHHFFAGINEDNSEYSLAPGEKFTTPELALTYSKDGLGGVSRNFHRWSRKYKLAHGSVPRKILLNSWEGVYFNTSEDRMYKMIEDIASMGGELFVMDDGWFGKKYSRNDSRALGDWSVDSRKLPGGIQGLIDTAHKNGIKFGIWIEPEMTNTVSELYEKHPEYVIKPAHRQPTTGRGGTQLVLDLGNPEVQQLVFNVVDTLLTNYPDIDYIKWDANASVMNHGSQYLADNQSHLFIEYHRGFAKVLDRLRKKYPDVTIQACASGGGRVNHGILPWFDEFWVSDNTDALQRIYMQWGTSYFFPAIAMASHISASPNHQTSRAVSLKYRIDVAMSGRLGLEMQPNQMTAEETELCRKAISEYKEIRPVVQFGDLYRLLSPYDRKGAASLMYVSPQKDKAVFYWWKTETFMGQQLPRVAMDGLDPDKRYRVRELNRIDDKPLVYEGMVFSGEYLNSNGLEMPLTHKVSVDRSRRNEYSSRVLYLEAVNDK